MKKVWQKFDLMEQLSRDDSNELELTTDGSSSFKTLTKTIEFDAKTKIIELDKIIREAHAKKKGLPHRAKISRALKLLAPLEKSKNPKAKERVREIMDILESIL